jgi:predicted permease
VKLNKITLNILKALFALILFGMLFITITATIDQNIFEAVGNMWPNWWFKATLADAYFGFLTFFVWVAYKEVHLWRKLLWFAAIMLLGNLAISAYMLLELYKVQVGDTPETLLTRRNG